MNINLLNRYFNQKYLKRQKHPKLNIFIWNYTETVQYSKNWDDLLYLCRALVTDEKGSIVARSFNKFFNYEEVIQGDYTNFKGNMLKDEYKVYEKYDGSLILIFYYRDEWIICSKGSFTSEQSAMARKILETKNLNLDSLNKDLCYSFEIIYPQNKIVVNYDYQEDLIFLAAFTKTGEQIDASKKLENLGFTVTHELPIKKHDELKAENIKNKEGYVLYYPKTGDRVKIKFENYVNLHRMVSKLTTKNLFEQIRKEYRISEILDAIPDEYYDLVHNFINEIDEEYDKTYSKLFSDFLKYKTPDRKEFAMAIKDFRGNYKKALFKLYNSQDVTPVIFDIIEEKVLSFDLFARPEHEFMKETTSEQKIQSNITKPNCVIFDVDGTLALHQGRNPYDMSKVNEDLPNEKVIYINNLIPDHIILCTGRSEDAENDTINWLKNNCVKYNDIYFRPYKNVEPDYIVKEKMWRHIARNYNILIIFDDRNQVVNHARKLGLTVFQVDELDK